jgi:hypothetical protein
MSRFLSYDISKYFCEKIQQFIFSISSSVLFNPPFETKSPIDENDDLNSDHKKDFYISSSISSQTSQNNSNSSNIDDSSCSSSSPSSLSSRVNQNISPSNYDFYSLCCIFFEIIAKFNIFYFVC